MKPLLLAVATIAGCAPAVAHDGPPRVVDRAIHRYFGHGQAARDAIAVTKCESGWRIHVKGRYRGLWQFDWITWSDLGGRGDPAEATAMVQTKIARRLWVQGGRTFSRAWPVCGAGR